METAIPRSPTQIDYEEAARRYARSLRPEHYMEATPQATQRKITLESFDLVSAKRPDVQIFNELLVQYPRPGKRKLGQVVPDNMVVISPEPIQALGSFDLKEQPVRPFMMLEYVSKYSERKDYDDNLDRYEQELNVPYYLLFYPDTQDLTLYRNVDRRFQAVQPNQDGRLPVPPLEMEVAILEGWVRFWFRGELLPLPGQLLLELDDMKRLLTEERARADREAERANDLEGSLIAEREARLAIERELEQLRATMRKSNQTEPRVDG